MITFQQQLTVMPRTVPDCDYNDNKNNDIKNRGNSTLKVFPFCSLCCKLTPKYTLSAVS